MIINEIQLSPRYCEVDQMGYVYHDNYLSYCHQAKTEFLRKINIYDKILEEHNIMLPVISFKIKCKKPAYYDDLIKIKMIIKEFPKVRFNFEFEIRNNENHLLSTAKSTVVFINSKSRYPIIKHEFVENALKKVFDISLINNNITN